MEPYLFLFCLGFGVEEVETDSDRRRERKQASDSASTTIFVPGVSISFKSIPARFLPHRTNLDGQLGHRADDAVDPAAQEHGRNGRA